MRFELTIPDPATLRAGKESYVTVASGTELHRIHRSSFESEQFNGTAHGEARFSPIYDADRAIIPTLYGAESFECAVCEIILRCPDVPPTDPKTGLPTLQIVFPSDFSEHSHSVVRTTRDLRLVDLTIGGQRRIGVDQNALLAGPRSTYPTTRAWAEQIHALCPTAHGLHYSSFQFGPHFAVLLFGDRVGVGALEEQSTRPVADLACHKAIIELAQGLSIDYADV